MSTPEPLTDFQRELADLERGPTLKLNRWFEFVVDTDACACADCREPDGCEGSMTDLRRIEADLERIPTLRVKFVVDAACGEEGSER